MSIALDNPFNDGIGHRMAHAAPGVKTMSWITLYGTEDDFVQGIECVVRYRNLPAKGDRPKRILIVRGLPSRKYLGLISADCGFDSTVHQAVTGEYDTIETCCKILEILAGTESRPSQLDKLS